MTKLKIISKLWSVIYDIKLTKDGFSEVKKNEIQHKNRGYIALIFLK